MWHLRWITLDEILGKMPDPEKSAKKGGESKGWSFCAIVYVIRKRDAHVLSWQLKSIIKVSSKYASETARLKLFKDVPWCEFIWMNQQNKKKNCMHKVHV